MTIKEKRKKMATIKRYNRLHDTDYELDDYALIHTVMMTTKLQTLYVSLILLLLVFIILF